jgi:hypothetical protein
MQPHQVHNLRNRARRIVRRLAELKHEVIVALTVAEKNGHEARTSHIDNQINSLRAREVVLHRMLDMS